MKKLYLICLLACIAMIFLSNSIGRGRVAGPATTAPGESGEFCGSFGCHGEGNFATTVNLELSDMDGNIIQEYLPGEEYNISIRINHIGFPPRFGFQIVALRESNNTAINSFSNLPPNTHDIILLGRQYVEHSAPLPTNNITMKWTAPEPGLGDVRFYAAGNAVNFNGDSTGDRADTTNLLIAESEPSSVLTRRPEDILFYPNPVEDILYLDAPNTLAKMKILDPGGRQLLSFTGKTVNLGFLPAGVYFLEIINAENERHVEKLIKF